MTTNSAPSRIHMRFRAHLAAGSNGRSDRHERHFCRRHFKRFQQRAKADRLLAQARAGTGRIPRQSSQMGRACGHFAAFPAGLRAVSPPPAQGLTARSRALAAAWRRRKIPNESFNDASSTRGTSFVATASIVQRRSEQPGKLGRARSKRHPRRAVR